MELAKEAPVDQNKESQEYIETREQRNGTGKAKNFLWLRSKLAYTMSAKGNTEGTTHGQVIHWSWNVWKSANLL